jgi:competence protein ComEA
MKILQNLAVRLGITRAEMSAVSTLLFFLIVGAALRYGGSIQEADNLIRKAEQSRFSEAEVDSLLRLASTVDYASVAEAGELETPGGETGGTEKPPGHRSTRAPKKSFTGVIAFNRASAAELQRIPGIGPAIARRLLSFRAEKGGKVRQFDDFLDVKGIGRKKLETLKKHLTLD